MTRLRTERLREAARRLAAAGIESARLDAELLLADVLGCDRLTLLLDRDVTLPVAAEARFAELIERRAGHEPVAHLLGRREFHGHDFTVGKATLIPRPDSETLVEAALSAFPERQGARGVLDLGTGSGCLLLSLLIARPAWRGTGIDLSDAALAVARDNAGRLGLADRATFLSGDWFTALPENRAPFDLAIANPPYIASGDIAHLMPEVACHEPHLALDGGADGLDACRAIARDLARHLAPGGLALIEIGAGQAAAAEWIFRVAGLAAGPRFRDLGGHERAISLCHPEDAEKWLGLSARTG